MEKRLFLAIGFSVLVVWLWSGVSPKGSAPTSNSKMQQTFDNKELTSNLMGENVTPPASKDEKISAGESEILEIIESDQLEIAASNIGATLKNVVLKRDNASLPLNSIGGVSGYDTVLFDLISSTSNEVVYAFNGDDLRIVKTYTMLDDGYLIAAKTEFHNQSNVSKVVEAGFNAYSIETIRMDKNPGLAGGASARDKSLQEYAISTDSGIKRKAGAHKFSAKEKREEFGKVKWAGFRNRYYCFIFKPEYISKGHIVDPVDENRLSIKVQSDQVTIPPGEHVEFGSTIFVGPEETDLLKKYEMGFEKIKKYYKFGLFDGVAKIIDGFMHLIFKVIPNWGVCIVIVSIVIYFSMYPLTIRSMLSMKKMQALQPKIAAMKEKHKDSPQKMNKEMMDLYKTHKVNPLGGCLPMLLQMPVFIGLYQVLWRSASFKGAKFLWMQDLSQPDRLFIFPFSLPFLGNEFNLLPILMIVIMFFQQKFTSKNMIATDPAQIAQQKMMATIMPVFLGFIFYKFASGLTLYFTMFYLFSTLTQWKMSKTKA